MKPIFRSLILVLFVGVSLAEAQTDFKLHSHNDYLRNVPFWEAFGAGAASIEVDVILQNDQLMVAHEQASIRPERTFSSLYVDPIRKAHELGMIREFGFHLLIDCKTEGYGTLAQIVKDAGELGDLLYSAQNPTGLKLIISGNRPKPEDYAKYPEWVLFDYQSKTLTPTLPWEKIGMVSLSFRQFSVWNGKGRIVEQELNALREFIALVHSFDKPVRFWASPDSKSAWKAFYELGVDYINTDQPNLAQSYLSTLNRTIYQTKQPHEVYHPSFDSDGKDAPLHTILFLIGDGNGLAQLSAGLFANGGELNVTQLRSLGLVKTQAADDFTTDSAAGATAYSSGKKTNNRAIGVDPSGDSLANLPEVLESYGFVSGIVTTDQVTGATPASFFAHHPERDDSDQLAAWLPKSKLSLFVGAGKSNFTRFGTDRIQELKSAGFDLVSSLEELGGNTSRRVGYFSSEGSQVSMLQGRGDFLRQSALQSLRFLSQKKAPIFLMLESAMIDSGGHSNHSALVVEEMLDFDQTIGELIRYVDAHPGTLMIVTADHETGGISIPQGNVSTGEVELAYHSDDHTGIPVPIFAYGVHSGDFQGVYENTAVFEKIMNLVKRNSPK
jgi:alkaline phosphatase